jgi:hypothetical protein
MRRIWTLTARFSVDCVWSSKAIDQTMISVNNPRRVQSQNTPAGRMPAC